MIEAVVGAGCGAVTIAVARVIRAQRWWYSIGLLVLPGLYGLFGLRTAAPVIAATEMLYGIPFVAAGLVFALVSVPYSAVVVGAFWILHGVYDLLHSRLITNPGVPGWYPAWCCAVDVVVGAYLLWLSRRVPDANLRRA